MSWTAPVLWRFHRARGTYPPSKLYPDRSSHPSEGGRGLPQSKTLRAGQSVAESPSCLGLRQSSGAFTVHVGLTPHRNSTPIDPHTRPKAVEDYRSPRRSALAKACPKVRHVLDCASPLALSPCTWDLPPIETLPRSILTPVRRR